MNKLASRAELAALGLGLLRNGLTAVFGPSVYHPLDQLAFEVYMRMWYHPLRKALPPAGECVDAALRQSLTRIRTPPTKLV